MTQDLFAHIEALSWKDLIVSGAAIVGAVLGIMNTWNSISQRKLRLRVTPVHIIGVPHGDGFAIGIINLSAFPVTVEEIGFLQRHGNGHLPIMQYAVYDGGSFPRRLEPRESVTVHFDPRVIIGRKNELSKAYARTACGTIITGNSGALRQILKEGLS